MKPVFNRMLIITLAVGLGISFSACSKKKGGGGGGVAAPAAQPPAPAPTGEQPPQQGQPPVPQDAASFRLTGRSGSGHQAEFAVALGGENVITKGQIGNDVDEAPFVQYSPYPRMRGWVSTFLGIEIVAAVAEVYNNQPVPQQQAQQAPPQSGVPGGSAVPPQQQGNIWPGPQQQAMGMPQYAGHQPYMDIYFFAMGDNNDGVYILQTGAIRVDKANDFRRLDKDMERVALAQKVKIEEAFALLFVKHLENPSLSLKQLINLLIDEGYGNDDDRPQPPPSQPDNSGGHVIVRPGVAPADQVPPWRPGGAVVVTPTPVVVTPAPAPVIVTPPPQVVVPPPTTPAPVGYVWREVCTNVTVAAGGSSNGQQMMSQDPTKLCFAKSPKYWAKGTTFDQGGNKQRHITKNDWVLCEGGGRFTKPICLPPGVRGNRGKQTFEIINQQMFDTQKGLWHCAVPVPSVPGPAVVKRECRMELVPVSGGVVTGGIPGGSAVPPTGGVVVTPAPGPVVVGGGGGVIVGPFPGTPPVPAIPPLPHSYAQCRAAGKYKVLVGSVYKERSSSNDNAGGVKSCGNSEITCNTSSTFGTSKRAQCCNPDINKDGQPDLTPWRCEIIP